MGSIKVNSKEKVGEVTYETEYTFSDASDFFAWENIKVERLTSAVKGLTQPWDFLDELAPKDEQESMVADVQVTKKPKEPTKH